MEGQYKTLAQELGFSGSASNEAETLRWDSTQGKLFRGSDVIRKVQVRKTKTNLQAILDAFQQRGWTDEIENPRLEPEHLTQTVHQLNDGLERIRFHVGGGGAKVYWREV